MRPSSTNYYAKACGAHQTTGRVRNVADREVHVHVAHAFKRDKNPRPETAEAFQQYRIIVDGVTMRAVHELWDADDPAASRIFGAAIARIREILTTLQAGDSLPVVFLGGLGPHYAARLGDPWPVKAAIGNSLDGAVLMARQMAGAA